MGLDQISTTSPPSPHLRAASKSGRPLTTHPLRNPHLDQRLPRHAKPLGLAVQAGDHPGLVLLRSFGASQDGEPHIASSISPCRIKHPILRSSQSEAGPRRPHSAAAHLRTPCPCKSRTFALPLARPFPYTPRLAIESTSRTRPVLPRFGPLAQAKRKAEPCPSGQTSSRSSSSAPARSSSARPASSIIRARRPARR